MGGWPILTKVPPLDLTLFLRSRPKGDPNTKERDHRVDRVCVWAFRKGVAEAEAGQAETARSNLGVDAVPSVE